MYNNFVLVKSEDSLMLMLIGKKKCMNNNCGMNLVAINVAFCF